MSFVPVTGPATFRAGEPPRDGARRVLRRAPHGRAADPGRAAGAHQGPRARRPAPERALLSGAALLGHATRRGRQVRPRSEWAVVAGRRAGASRRGPDHPARHSAGARRVSTRRPPRGSCAPCSTPWPTRCRGPPRSRRGGRRSPAASPRRARHTVDPDFTRRLQERVARARARSSDDRPQLVVDRAADRGRRGGAGRWRRTRRAPGPRLRERRPRLRCRRALDRVRPRRESRLRRPRAHPRQHRAACGRRRVAGARALPRAARPRRADPRHRRARQPARHRRHRPQGGRGRRALAAPPRPRRHREGRADRGAEGSPARGGAADRALRPGGAVRLPVAARAARRRADRRGDGPARRRRDARSSRSATTGPSSIRRCSSAPSAG